MNTNFIKKTKIISSVGPATRSEEKIIELYKAWVNVIRINFSHADYENTSRIVEIVKRLNKEGVTKLWLLWDLKWPEIRLWDYEGAKTYHKWDTFNIFVDKQKLDTATLDQFCDYPYLIDDVQVWQIVRIESGIFDVLVKDKTTDCLIVEALNDTTIKQRRHVNLPGTTIKLPGLIDQDKENVLFCIQNEFDYIAMSFVRNAAHIQELRTILTEHNMDHIGIISKVENQEWLDNIEEIVDASDGVMVARGDLGIEIDISLIPVRQRKIVKLCRSRGKFVIVATQLIESMMETPFPTRAEVSDVFNAVVQKADAVMTSWETALGKYPIECISMMKKIIMQAETSLEYEHEEFTDSSYTESDLEKKALIKSAIEVANNLNINSIMVFTKSGKLAKIAAAYRPKINIFAFTNRRTTLTNSVLYFWVKSRYIDYDHHADALEEALQIMIKMWDIEGDEKTLVVTDIKKNWHNNPVLEIINVKQFLGL